MGATATSTSVLVVDDHKTVADLLAVVLDADPDFTCVGTAPGVAKGLAMVHELKPDLVLMDVHLGDGDGVEATSELTATYPELRVVVMTAHADAPLMRRASDAGACCLLHKDGSLTDLLQALRTARRGGLIVHPALLESLMASRPRRRSDYLPPLTRRERDVLKMLADGAEAREISKKLGISVHTCRSYLKSLLQKLNAHSQLEAVVIAKNHGLVWVPTGAIPGGTNRRKED
jgi:DNA-binding NarL/FixJ family response regulator